MFWIAVKQARAIKHVKTIEEKMKESVEITREMTLHLREVIVIRRDAPPPGNSPGSTPNPPQTPTQCSLVPPPHPPQTPIPSFLDFSTPSSSDHPTPSFQDFSTPSPSFSFSLS
ncbi:putative uncharacterized protein DDB_G0290521 [Silurus meridionalis]|uniref:putative uncharacterized protein DDB_G0290521 n=1 Tax=Silurus meridionalis TaxID=175797 RepID=UPI001EEC8490|nr:putative uncharacterized protein DDB_G0290521 [Silurus meridionalis]